MSEDSADQISVEKEARDDEVIKEVIETSGSVLATWATKHNASIIDGHGVSIRSDMDPSQFTAQYNGVHGRSNTEIKSPLYTAFGPEPAPGQELPDMEGYMAKNGMREAVIFDTLAWYDPSLGVTRGWTTGLTRTPSPETTMRITYIATEGGRAGLINRESNGEEIHYKDLVGRAGNYLAFQIMVPESVGKNVQEATEEDPLFVRKLVDQTVRKTYDPTFVKETWDKFGKPPYEQWDKSPEPKMMLMQRTVDPRLGTATQTPNFPQYKLSQVSLKK